MVGNSGLREKMVCTGTGSKLDCTYNVLVDNSWSNNAEVWLYTRDERMLAHDINPYGEMFTVAIKDHGVSDARPIVQITSENIWQVYSKYSTKIYAVVTDPDGDFQQAKISIKSPSSLSDYNILNEPMQCTRTDSSASNRIHNVMNCWYEVKVDNSWGSTAKVAAIARDYKGQGEWATKTLSVDGFLGNKKLWSDATSIIQTTVSIQESNDKPPTASVIPSKGELCDDYKYEYACDNNLKLFRCKPKRNRYTWQRAYFKFLVRCKEPGLI